MNTFRLSPMCLARCQMLGIEKKTSEAGPCLQELCQGIPTLCRLYELNNAKTHRNTESRIETCASAGFEVCGGINWTQKWTVRQRHGLERLYEVLRGRGCALGDWEETRLEKQAEATCFPKWVWCDTQPESSITLDLSQKAKKRYTLARCRGGQPLHRRTGVA